MKRAWTLTLLIAPTMSAWGDECIVSDAFGAWSGLFGLAANQTTGMQMAFGDGKVQAYSPYGWYTSAPAMAAAMSYGWQMDMLQDWAIQVDLHINPPLPAQGDVGMSIVVMLEGDPATMTMTRAWTFGGGTYYNYLTGAGYVYRSTLIWINNAASSDLFGYGRPVDDTWYVWWDADTGVIYGGDTLHATSGAFATSLNGFSSSSAAWVGFGGYGWGDVPAFNGAMWGDDICVLYGNAVGAAVGACCMGDECVQVPQAGCDGTFLGYGTVCGGCICDGAPSCPGDFFDDQIVNSTDLNLLLAAWGTDTCAYDIDGSGTVGMLDLLTLLRNWGSCS